MIASGRMALQSSLAKLVPAVEWLPQYDRAWLPRDVVAGLTTSAVVLPKAMAFAALAGLPVQAGLYTALVPVAVYAVLGSSRRLSVSSTTTIAILTAAEIAAVAPDGDPAKAMMAASTLAVMVGFFLVLASVLRLGFLANFVSNPVLAGFKAGLGVVIVVDQIPKLLGIHIQRGGFFENIASIVRGAVVNTGMPRSERRATCAGDDHGQPTTRSGWSARMRSMSPGAGVGRNNAAMSSVMRRPPGSAASSSIGSPAWTAPSASTRR